MQAAAERTMQELERVRDNPLALRDFLKRMPKGADLHNHLHSAVYAETFIKEAIEDGLCVDPAKNAFDQPHPVTGAAPQCEPGKVPAATVYKDLRLYNGLINSFPCAASCRRKGRRHDHFFGAFKKFGGIDPRIPAPGSMRWSPAPPIRTSNISAEHRNAATEDLHMPAYEVELIDKRNGTRIEAQCIRPRRALLGYDD